MLDIGQVTESLVPDSNGGCTWTIAIDMGSTEKPGPTVTRINLEAPAGSYALPKVGLPVTIENERTSATLSYAFEVCPASPDDIEHDRINLNYQEAGNNQLLGRRIGF